MPLYTSKRHKVDIITMGCSKNLVDSERLMHMFDKAGFEVFHNPEKASGGITIINTCGFIGDAKEESIDMILKCCREKAEGKRRAVYVMGCLSERYSKELPIDIPEVDGWYGKFDWIALIGEITGKSTVTPSAERHLTTYPHQAYLKIAEGCNRFCAFCAIPMITGRYTSRTQEDIIDEVKSLVAKGVKELNVIAQDLTYYGTDIYGKPSIAELVEKIALVPGVEWIRLHYAYPKDFPMDLLDVMARYPNVCNYLDIALQHCNDKVLSNMQRHINCEETTRLLEKIREKVPGIHIRTTLMVGFPGEDEEAFEELCEFTRKQRFERMGAFAYCEEDDTFGARNFNDDIPEETKQKRLDSLMSIQEDIAREINMEKVGKDLKVLIDYESPDYYIGRTEFDSPDVDNEVLVKKTRTLVPGRFYNVRIVDALPFDLIGEVL